MKGTTWILTPLLLHLSSSFGLLTSRTPIQEHFVFTDDDKMTWRDARAYCRKHHTDLATIESAALNDDLYMQGGWIGLHKETPSGPWKWARENKDATFFSWEDDEPQAGQDCVLKYFKSHEWKSLPCDNKQSFLCSDEKLFLVKENKTWEEALDHCRSLRNEDANDTSSPVATHSHDLATLIDPKYIIHAQESQRDATTDEVWTGLRFLAGRWRWVGGEEVQHETLLRCPALRTCGVLEKSANVSFQIRDCTERRNFLCHRRE